MPLNSDIRRDSLLVFLLMAFKWMEDVHLSQKTFPPLPSNFPLADVESSSPVLEEKGIKRSNPTHSWPEARSGCWNRLQGSKPQSILHTLSVFPFALQHLTSSLPFKPRGLWASLRNITVQLLEGGSCSFRWRYFRTLLPANQSSLMLAGS